VVDGLQELRQNFAQLFLCCLIVSYVASPLWRIGRLYGIRRRGATTGAEITDCFLWIIYFPA
jgi:hypothetical protein